MPNCKRFKRGVISGKQSYCCKDCKYHFVIGDQRTEKGYSQESKALAVLLDGAMKVSDRMIASVLSTARKTVYP